MTTKRAPHRYITERWVVTGKLVLETPAHFGNGDADPLTDMPLLVDETSGAPLLHGDGASAMGAAVGLGALVERHGVDLVIRGIRKK